MTDESKVERFSVKLFEEAKTGGAKIYIKKEHYEKIKEMLNFPPKKELMAEINMENERLCIWIM